MSFTLDRYGHLYPEADTALRDRLDALYVAGTQAEPGVVIELRRDASRPQRGPGTRGNTAATRVRMLAGERIPKSCTALHVHVPLAAQ